MQNLYRLSIAIFIVCISLINVIPTVHAENSINIIDESVDIHFPGALVFNIQANSNSDIVDIRLSYVVERMNFAYVISEAWPDFVPSTNVDTSWIWDTRRGRLPPGASINYWWTIENLNGDKTTTEVKTVYFNDNTHTWNEVKSANISILWYEGDKDFADKLIASAIDSLDRLTRDTGAKLEEPIKIYIYASSEDLQQSMVYPREWTGGVAFTEYNIIAIGIEPGNLEWGENALAHELGHAAVHQITYSPYIVNLPTWLDEGLAQHAEITINSYLESILKTSVKNNTLISLRSLCSPFSAIPQQAYLSYAESRSVVEYLIEKYGSDKIFSLLMTFKEGSTCDSALETVYGMDMDVLETEWIESLNEKYSYQKQHTSFETIAKQDIFQYAANLSNALLVPRIPAVI
jgi:hypothetical protein